MSATTKPIRDQLSERLGEIEARIMARTGELAEIETRQLAAATAGDPPDVALSTAKAALLDAQSIDERAAAAVRAQIDQLDAEARHEQQLAELASTRRKAAAAARTAQAVADGFPAVFQGAQDAVRAAAEQLVAVLADLEAKTREATLLNDAVRAQAEALGEPIGAVSVVDHVRRAAVVAGDLPRARVFNMARRGDAPATAGELAVAAFVPSPAPDKSGPAQGISTLSNQELQRLERERRQRMGLPSFAEEAEMRRLAEGESAR